MMPPLISKKSKITRNIVIRFYQVEGGISLEIRVEQPQSWYDDKQEGLYA
jgi:hypothetical protein